MGIECVMVPYAAAGLAVVSGIMMMVELVLPRTLSALVIITNEVTE